MYEQNEYLKIHAQHQLDSFFCHQLVVRRFEAEDHATFSMLRELREKIETLIWNGTHDRQFLMNHMHFVTHLTARLMNSLVNLYLANSLRDDCMESFYSMLDEVDGVPKFALLLPRPPLVSTSLSEKTKSDIFTELKRYLDAVNSSMQSDHPVTIKEGDDNISAPSLLTIYTPYALTVKIDFQLLLDFMCEDQIVKRHTLGMYYEVDQNYNYITENNYLNWIFAHPEAGTKLSEECKYCSLLCDLYALNKLFLKQRRILSKNVRIRDDDTTLVQFDGKKSKNCIHLSVNFSELPENIDNIISQFAATLKSKLTDNGFYRANATRGDFWSSKFADVEMKSLREIKSNQNEQIFLLNKLVKSYPKFLYGILLYDLGQSEGTQFIIDRSENANFIGTKHNRVDICASPPEENGNLQKDLEFVRATVSFTSKAARRACLNKLYLPQFYVCRCSNCSKKPTNT
ncbi:hypothetical protein [Vibrio metschnikovii]|uniref:hypothetical protein n=1 Tax=Vibrio metschnikovii TaxID=28172 RepID=UPI001648E612|nr:hypothetical protein [Vibrio metschnikovii]MBC3620398.1 hypothetical protein [Vibrio metschnikovii]